MQATSGEQFGLKEDWTHVEEILRDVLPVYEKTNRYISLGSDLRIRKMGLGWLRRAIEKDSSVASEVLDLGAGPGRMSELLGSPTILLDALAPMIQVATKRNPHSDGMMAVYESLPIRPESLQAAMAGFAIRDARNLQQALHEISGCLKNGGHFLVVDLSKPDSRLKRGMIDLYWRILAPLIALFAVGKPGLKFAALSTTYRRLPTNSQLLKLAKDADLELESSKYFMLDGACILLFQKRAIKI